MLCKTQCRFPSHPQATQWLSSSRAVENINALCTCISYRYVALPPPTYCIYIDTTDLIIVLPYMLPRPLGGNNTCLINSRWEAKESQAFALPHSIPTSITTTAVHYFCVCATLCNRIKRKSTTPLTLIH